MSMQVKAGYVNPLTMRKENKLQSGQNRFPGKQNHELVSGSQVKELQVKQQQLQSEMLLMKSTGTDGGSSSVEKLEKMEERILEVSKKLKEARKEEFTLPKRKPDLDTYEKGWSVKKNDCINGWNEL